MGAQVGNNDGKVRPDINVTPLVDVVLVLLIIFMVITPQLENDVQLDLPQILNVDPEKKKDFDPLEVSLAGDGRIRIESVDYDLDTLPEILKATLEENPRRKLAIRADKEHEFKEVRDLFAVVRESGYRGAALMVNEVKTGTGEGGS